MLSNAVNLFPLILPLSCMNKVPPYVLRATAVKNELSDAEGLGYKVEEKIKEIVELKKAIRLKVRGCIQSPSVMCMLVWVGG